MSLEKLINKQSLNVLGLNSGTSADGLDMAAVKIRRTKGGMKITFLDALHKTYPEEIRQMILKMADAGMVALDKVIYLDNILGSFFGETASKYITRLNRNKIPIDMVASHGQTVRHLPEKIKIGKYSLTGTRQLGSISFIAALTDRVTVGDFRQADIALGNEGAPITAAAMERIYADPKESRLIVNIGGMANYFYLPAKNIKRKIRVADCGPGNSLCDILSKRLFDEKFDKKGQIALGGNVSQRLLSLLLSKPFFNNKTVSTGRESFGQKIADEILAFKKRFNLPDEDLVATAAELTVYSIAMKVRPLLKLDKRLEKLYLTGGGRKNIFFVKRLIELLPELKILAIDKIGISGDYVEAAAFAVMGEAAVRSERLPTCYPESAGSMLRPVMGVIAQPPGK